MCVLFGTSSTCTCYETPMPPSNGMLAGFIQFVRRRMKHSGQVQMYLYEYGILQVDVRIYIRNNFTAS